MAADDPGGPGPAEAQDLARLTEAAAWRVRLSEAGLETSEAFETWIEADSLNRDAWARVQEPWRDFDALAVEPGMMAARRDALARAAQASRDRVSPGLSRRSWMAVAAGLAVAAIAMAGAYSWLQPAIYETKMGERRTIRLADGSEVALDAASSLTVRYRRDARSLDLVRGQARFNVAHDAARPFTVHAGNQTVVATGTSFNVDLLGPRVIVTLLQGHVSIIGDAPRPGAPAAGRAAPPRSIPLSVGYRLVASAAADAPPPRVEAVSLDRTVAWERGQLVFDDEPLSLVTERISRYSARPVGVSDPRVAALRISGVFTAGDLPTFLDTVTSYLPVRATPQADGSIDLQSRG